MLYREADAVHAPSHWLAEAANTVWSMFAVRGEISLDQMTSRITTLNEANVQVTLLADLVESAARISAALRMSIYDSLYVALAAKTDLPLVTADRRLFQLTRDSIYQDLTHWIGAIG